MSQQYYQAAISLLRFVEQRTPTERRFGPNAEAAWGAFKGDLKTSDRIQLLIADAHAQWPGSVGPSSVYLMKGVAADDAFGPDWQPLEGTLAEKLWRNMSKREAPSTVRDALHSIAASWEFELKSFVPPDVKPGQSVVVVGPSAVAATIEYFASHPDLNWSRQVTAVATEPSHRQLAASAGVLLNLTDAPAIVCAAAPPEKKAKGQLIASDDVTDADRAFAESLGKSA